MKKQILFLAMFAMALIFIVSNTSAQTYINYVESAGTPACAPAATLNCGASALAPTPGVEYPYSVTVDPANVSSVHWFVTDDEDVILGAALVADIDPADGSGYVISAGPEYDELTNTALSINVTWQWFDGVANKVLLVAYVKGAAGCSDEIEAWRIQPSFSFALNVLSMFDNGTLGTVGSPASECVSPVESATFDGTNMSMDYGENWVFFSVNAANYIDSWMPTLSASSSAGKSIPASAIQWAYPNQAGASGTWHEVTEPIEAQIPSGIVGSDGECIVVRVRIDHGNVGTPRGAATETITLSVDGIMHDAAGYTNSALADRDEQGGTCVGTVTDKADYTLLARPAVTAVAPIPFVPKN